MPVLYLKLRDRSDNVFLQSILGTYSHLMWVRTEDPENHIVKIITTDDLFYLSLEVLVSVKKEIAFDFLKTLNSPIKP